METYCEYIEELIQLGEDAIYSGDFILAKRLLMNGLKEEPGYPKLHYTMGWMYHYYQVNEPLALMYYRYAITFNKGYEEAYRDYVTLLTKRRMFNEVIDLMQNAARVDEVDKDFVFETLGKMYEKQGNFGEAIKCYLKALNACIDNDFNKELRQNIRRARRKKLKLKFSLLKI